MGKLASIQSALPVESAIERALDFLQRGQKPSGEFGFYRVWFEGEPHRLYDGIPFPTALIATSLAFCDSPLAKAMIARACVSLRNQMEAFGVWRYWPPPRPDCVMVLPDVDDIAVISSVLRQNGVKIPDNRGIILANRNRTGLFYTWIIARKVLSFSPGYWWVASEKWRRPYGPTRLWESEAGPSDLDGVVNSNVLSYLGAGPETEAVCDYLIDIFKDGQEEICDKWYQNRFIFYYSIARNYSEGISAFAVIREEMIERIVSSAAPDGMIGSGAMDTAHAACALLSLKSDAPELDAAIRHLIQTQGPGGEWPYTSYYFSGRKRAMAWGSEELTTGFCLQALARYARRAKA
jgi:hypothetical protein